LPTPTNGTPPAASWCPENKKTWVSRTGAARAEPPPSQGKTVTTLKPPKDKESDKEKVSPKGDSAGAATDAPPAKP